MAADVTAYEAAVRAVAGAIPRDDVKPLLAGNPHLARYYRERAAEGLAALATDPDVRAALVRAITAEDAPRWAEPDHEAGPAIRPWPLVDAILAALRPPEAPDWKRAAVERTESTEGVPDDPAEIERRLSALTEGGQE